MPPLASCTMAPKDGVIGSCRQLLIDVQYSLLINYGLFPRKETSANGRSGVDCLAIEFPLDTGKALIATHVRIDRVGSIPFGDEEALKQAKHGQSQLLAGDSHQVHVKMVRHPAETARPVIVVGGSGICRNGRIVNYLKAMRHDVRFVG